MVREKNTDELFQQFMWHTGEVDKEGLKEGVKVDTSQSVDKDKIREDSEQAQPDLPSD